MGVPLPRQRPHRPPLQQQVGRNYDNHDYKMMLTVMVMMMVIPPTASPPAPSVAGWKRLNTKTT